MHTHVEAMEGPVSPPSHSAWGQQFLGPRGHKDG